MFRYGEPERGADGSGDKRLGGFDPTRDDVGKDTDCVVRAVCAEGGLHRASLLDKEGCAGGAAAGEIWQYTLFAHAVEENLFGARVDYVGVDIHGGGVDSPEYVARCVRLAELLEENIEGDGVGGKSGDPHAFDPALFGYAVVKACACVDHDIESEAAGRGAGRDHGLEETLDVVDFSSSGGVRV